MVKAVIFDVDGLMIDTEHLHSDAHASVIKEYGKKPVENSAGIVHIIGKSILENSEIIRKQYDINETAEILQEKKHKEYLKLLKTKKIKPIPGLIRLITSLKKHNIKMAIGTGGIHKALSLILENLGLTETFSVVIAFGDVKLSKPFPDTYLEAAKRLGVSPGECVVLEDSQTGIEAGKNAGMKVIAIPNKYTKSQDFSKADKIVESLKEVNMQLLKNL